MIGTPSLEHRRTTLASVRPTHRGLDALVHGWHGRISSRASIRSALEEEATSVQEQTRSLQDLTAVDLTERLQHWRSVFRRRDEMPANATGEALAIVAETARRELGLRPHRAQLMAALAVERGFLLEMATGEGKTLTVALAAVLAGWTGRPCHILTANDYLASRDAEWLSGFYGRCGLTVGCVTGEMKPCERRTNYLRDITYTTSKEAAADFLRDRLQLGNLAGATRRLIRTMLQPGAGASDSLVMRGLHTAIIDEADNALIDEAVTPLIISRKQENEPLRRACEVSYEIASELQPGVDYTRNEKFQEIVLLPDGFEKIRSHSVKLPPMWRGPQRAAELVRQALRAREFYHRGKQYVIEEDKVVIVDEFTGRLMAERTWREGLHQAVEAKEKVPVTAPAETLARLSFQRFFRLYHRLSGLSGTVAEAASEVWQIYRLPVVRIPTNKPCRRMELPDRLFADDAAKWSAIVDEICVRHGRRQPLLVGVRSVAASERLAKLLEQRGLVFNLLNATRHREESAIIAQAGEQGRITIATNMAGRGTDISLAPLVAEIGGLHVLLTERHESRRIDRQLMGRAARQGDPGSAQAFVSLEDELPVRHAPTWWRQRVQAALKIGVPGAQTSAAALINAAQRRSEKASFRQRRNVLQTDTWIEDSLAFAGEDLAS